MKKSLLSVFTMVAMAAAFTACSNDDIEVPDVKNGEARSVFMKLELPTLTRSTEPPVASGTVATVSNLHVYFHDGTSILKYVNATTTTPITIANLTTGTQITDVPAAATTVTVCGNIPAGTSLPTGGTVAALKAVQLEITSQSAVADVVLSGDDKPLQTWTTGSPALPYAPGITDGDKYAEVEIGPAVARVEIEGLATTASSAVDGFTLEGIYVNNFFEKFNLAGTAVLLLLPMLKDRGFTPLLTLENSLTSLPSLLQVSQRKSFRQLQGNVGHIRLFLTVTVLTRTSNSSSYLS